MKRINELKHIPLRFNSDGSVGPDPQDRYFPKSDGAIELLEQANQCYASMYTIRKNVRRADKYYRGNQWSDIVVVDGKEMTEEEYILSQGRPALKQNLIRPPVRNILGQFRKSPYKSVVISTTRDDQAAAEMMSAALESVHEMNKVKEVDVRELENYLVGGYAIYETSFTYDERRKRSIPTVTPISIEQFFQTPSARDIRGKDVDFIGHFVDCPIDEVVSTYAKTPAEEKALREIYSSSRRNYWTGQVKNKPYRVSSFYVPDNPNDCRIYKIWRLEGSWKYYVHDPLDGSYEIYEVKDLSILQAENIAREALAIEQGSPIPLMDIQKRFIREWKVYHLTPTGHCLFKGENPYLHGDHPYIVSFYPMHNNQVWSLVDDMIDQNRMINRMVILQDFILSASAKGVLIVPEDCITDDFTLEDIAEQWTKYNGVIKIKLKPGAKAPEQIASRAMPTGITDMINLQLKLINDIGGVHEAMQGKTAASGTPAGLYQQEAMNAQNNIVDYLDSFGAFLENRDYKLLQLIQQYYTEPQYIALAGKTYSEEARHFDPQRIRDIDFENRISKATDTPAMRLYMDDLLKMLLEGQYIGIETFLEHSSMPFADKLLQTVQRQKEQLQQGQVPDGMALQQQMRQYIPESSQEGMQNAQKLYNLSKGSRYAAAA